MTLNDSEIETFINRNSDSYKNTILTFADRYLEQASMIFDLFPFIPFISQLTKTEIATQLEAKLTQI